jgi:hypothetical protein
MISAAQSGTRHIRELRSIRHKIKRDCCPEFTAAIPLVDRGGKCAHVSAMTLEKDVPDDFAVATSGASGISFK